MGNSVILGQLRLSLQVRQRVEACIHQCLEDRQGAPYVEVVPRARVGTVRSVVEQCWGVVLADVVVRAPHRHEQVELLHLFPSRITINFIINITINISTILCLIIRIRTIIILVRSIRITIFITINITITIINIITITVILLIIIIIITIIIITIISMSISIVLISIIIIMNL